MCVQSLFRAPTEDATPSEIEDAVRLINSVRLKPDQVERGYAVYQAQLNHRPQSRRWANTALRTFCRNEGLFPVDVALHSILMRKWHLLDAACDGYDYAVEDPDGYVAITTGPIDATWFGLYPEISSNDNEVQEKEPLLL